MYISVTELKEHLSKYLKLSMTQDIFITKNNKVIAKLTNPNKDRVNLVESLIGVISDDISLEDAKEERIKKL